MPLRDTSGKILEIVWLIEKESASDFSGEIMDNIYDMVTKDPVTGLFGRKYLESYLSGKIEEYRRTGSLFAFLISDIDQFRTFNNIYGHDVGDRILNAFGNAMSKNGRKADCWGRWGDDEFAAVLNINNRSDINSAAKRFYDTADGIKIEYGEIALDLHMSIGVTAIRDEDDLNSIISRAEEYMLKAKDGVFKDKVVTDDQQ